MNRERESFSFWSQPLYKDAVTWGIYLLWFATVIKLVVRIRTNHTHLSSVELVIMGVVVASPVAFIFGTLRVHREVRQLLDLNPALSDPATIDAILLKASALRYHLLIVVAALDAMTIIL